jgi:hypothetical protein
VLVVGGVQIGTKLVSGFPEFVVQGFEELLFRVVHCFPREYFDRSILFRIAHRRDDKCRFGRQI